MTTKIIQLDLFDSLEKQKLNEEEEFKIMVTRSLRGLFARYTELMKLSQEMEQVVWQMNKRLCSVADEIYKQDEKKETASLQ